MSTTSHPSKNLHTFSHSQSALNGKLYAKTFENLAYMSKNWAICIGINDYYNRIAKLQYAVRDAHAVRDFFLNEIKFERVFYFADDAPPIETENGQMRSSLTYANLVNFFGQLQNLFQRNVLTVGDNLWFFFSGHGQLHNGYNYLMPIDVAPDNLDKTALKLSDITAILRNSGADNPKIRSPKGVNIDLL